MRVSFLYDPEHFYTVISKKFEYLIGEKKAGEKWPNFLLDDQILTELKF